MKKIITLLLLLPLISIFASMEVSAQTPPLNWARSYGWAFTEPGNAIALDGSGNIYIAGAFFDTVDFDPGTGVNNIVSNGGLDIYILKLDPAGNLVWVKTIGGPDDDHGKAISIDGSGNVLVCGWFKNTADFNPGTGTSNLTATGSTFDAFVLKLDAAGDFVWANRMGGFGIDFANGIQSNTGGEIYVTGLFNVTVDFDPGPAVSNLTSSGFSDGFILKLSNNGNLIWVKKIGSTGIDESNALVLDTDGNIYLTGLFSATVDFDPGPATNNLTATNYYDIFVLKLDSAAGFLWARNMEGGVYDYAYSITLDNNGNVYSTGEFSGTVDFDPGPAISNLTATGIQADIYVHKMDAAGNFIWCRNFGGAADDRGNGIITDNSGNVFTSGEIGFLGGDLDPGTSVFSVPGGGSGDAFIQCMDASGNFLWASTNSSVNIDKGTSLAKDAAGNIYSAGTFAGLADFDPGPAVLNLPFVSPGVNVFIQQFGATVGLNETGPSFSLHMYPNPARDRVTITAGQEWSGKWYRLFNQQGGKVAEGVFSSGAVELPLSFLPSGLYCLQVEGFPGRGLSLIKE
jgi:hypothetical protein